MRRCPRDFGDDLLPGDVFIVNDPFDGGIHLPDIFVVKPVFLDDATGRDRRPPSPITPTSAGGSPAAVACDRPRCFQEGLRIPCVRLYEGGVPSSTRVRADPRQHPRPGQRARRHEGAGVACDIGERGLLRARGALRRGGLSAQSPRLLDHTEGLLRREIRRLARRHRRVHRLPRLRRRRSRDVPITVTVPVAGRRDWTSATRRRRSGRAQQHAVVRRVERLPRDHGRCSADIPNTGGVTRPITVTTTPGTITHVVLPAHRRTRGVTGYRVSTRSTARWRSSSRIGSRPRATAA